MLSIAGAARLYARKLRRNALCLRQPRMSNVGLKQALVLSAVVLFTSLGADAGDRLHMRVTPRVGLAPSILHIYVGVERNAENRLLRVVAESADFFRSSEVQLDGEESPRVSTFTFRDLPSGSYEVRAELLTSNGKTAGMERADVLIQ
jgi:hypothetical protein